MKLSALCIDDNVCIIGGKDVGGGLARQDLRDSSFYATDGWELRRVAPGLFTIWREGMAEPTFLEGYGISFNALAPPNTEAESWREYATLGSSVGKAADGQAPGTSADPGSKPGPATTKARRK